MSSSGGGSGCLVVILGVIGVVAAIWHFDFRPLSEDTTIYIRQCDDNAVEGTRECQRWKYREPVTYTIDKGSQVVIKKVHGENRFIKLESCAVKDRRNWTCMDGYREISLVDGKYFVNRERIESSENVEQATRLQYFIDTY